MIPQTQHSRPRARLTADEAATPTGRALHWLEARLLDGAHALGLFETAHERERLHDAERDRINREAIAMGDAGASWIQIRPLLVEANDRIDQLADTEDATGARYVTVSIRRVIQRIGGLVERSCKALRGRERVMPGSEVTT